MTDTEYKEVANSMYRKELEEERDTLRRYISRLEVFTEGVNDAPTIFQRQLRAMRDYLGCLNIRINKVSNE